MIVVRALFAIVLSVSLAALPARMGAIGISLGMEMTAGMPDCQLITQSTGASDELTMTASDTTSMTDIDQRSGHQKSARPGACSTFCNSVPLTPTFAVEPVQILSAEIIVPSIDTILDGLDSSPEPHPPKLV